ncbi:Imm39 family immunity protein [Pseudomonas sp. zfem001]|uniref:Imm39 family immunity protein n=1 Tax=Pseudomonas sp. zfem001 TaxID=3078196 RepID=UPI002927CADC|nr:Imm39 family immunity protein [Pseudomonas sp. zfem001]MDU9409554.1 Imm39 family immunity protein [Pseudomonas sp. zfem001]
MNDYLLLLGGVGLVKGKVKGFGPALLQASKELSECMRSSSWSTSAPFEKVSLIIKYGADASQKVEIGRINKHKELEASIQIPLEQLKNSSNLETEIKEISIHVLNLVSTKYGLPKVTV